MIKTVQTFQLNGSNINGIKKIADPNNNEWDFNVGSDRILNKIHNSEYINSIYMDDFIQKILKKKNSMTYSSYLVLNSQDNINKLSDSDF